MKKNTFFDNPDIFFNFIIGPKHVCVYLMKKNVFTVL